MKMKAYGAALALALAASQAHAAVLVNITGIAYTGTATAGESSLNLNNPDNLINGNGLSAPLTIDNIDSLTHANAEFASPGNAWSTASVGSGDFFGADNGTVSFELVFDQTYTITNFYNWVYASGGTNNAGNVFTLDYGVGDFASSTGSIDLGSGAPGSILSSTLDITADRIRINVIDNINGGDRAGLAEVAFVAAQAVPEPSSALLGAGGLALLGLRRRR